ncbi:class III extradiol ring-cleavage dioxygenase [Paucibacter sp. APW11]|uniref:Class III extradiol ring-cleavage dioxygenase n=1 Tax=Roseateles aquae TaxID=3077235 RepID=A0ABU3PA02_9BURK|nr:class III extradiol ring-cleavage dioxygenase [Paucibacter sp. APW11]MDT8999374.1 class III extradiol ring-cleavage dioxygenase [Paucibacter sp. APW11]
MDSKPFPALFLSHGSPMTALEPREAGAFMSQLGQTLDHIWGRPRAVLALSAHSLAHGLVGLAADRHEAVYDFGGFDPALYRLRYDAPGAPALADRLAALLGSRFTRHPQGGLDHGIWTPMRYLYPDASVPVLPLAWSPHESPERLFKLGQDLAPLLREGVLLLASGSITHNLRLVFQGHPEIDAAETPASAAFREWIRLQSTARAWPALFDYRRQAPHAVDMHPTDEHLLPWFIAAGAGGPDAVPQRLHASLTYGCLGMDAYAFGDQALKLQVALHRND